MAECNWSNIRDCLASILNVGCLGHVTTSCPTKLSREEDKEQPSDTALPLGQKERTMTNFGPWMVVAKKEGNQG
ncbi:conserved hypothetical protein [Ricinus communis]|uniref:Uncharacterized protein n=1 Tax=Ricinus communis TaxID=3988 RepID=B9RPS5_RICCO|nr:conserved hypothetical protein [Ricinus communis]